jgi:anthranilate phosphoribosyltransferase
MKLQAAIKHVIARQDLTSNDMVDIMNQIMTGEATPAQIGGFLVGLAMKGETVTEIAAAAKVMRSLATPVDIKGDHIVDTCGTGGDGASTFNVSTASAFVVSAAGAKVAKHGNRSFSSSSGSADVLEAAGVNLDITPEQVKHCIDTIGVGFMFSQKHHGAMKHAIGPRREMAVRTIFNLLGPLTNPAQAQHQVLGVFDKKWVEPMAHVLKELGSKHVLLVHAEDGLDEISIGSATYISELKDNAQESLAIINAIFEGETGPARDIVVLNAGAAIYAADIALSLNDGIELAKAMIDNGSAKQKLHDLVTSTNA